MGLADLIRSGDLIPVQVFGTDSYGLMDRYTTHTPSGSDCNRAVGFIMRPTDELMNDPEVKAAIAEWWVDPWNELDDPIDEAIARVAP